VAKSAIEREKNANANSANAKNKVAAVNRVAVSKADGKPGLPWINKRREATPAVCYFCEPSERLQALGVFITGLSATDLGNLKSL
jgi:hypothetical protein